MADNLNQLEEHLTPVGALQLVSSFFDKEWPQTEVKDVQLRQMTDGFVNRLHLLTRNNAVSQEPASVLIRHFGTSGGLQDPLESSTSLSAAEQAVIYFEMGRRGWGPKVYGLFRGGRVEEYIDSHTLTAAESKDTSIRRDLARSFARLHSLQLPLRRRNFEVAVRELKRADETKASVIQKLLAVASPEAKEFADILRHTDWTVELDWVSGLFKEHKCKPAIAIGDDNFLNVLVKNYESDCRVVLIDYETATYSYRGIDIGGHFNERIYRWSHPESKLTGYPAPDINEQRSFCESYLQEMRDLGQEITANDTVAHLLLESEIGRMYQILFSILMGVVFEMPDDPSTLSGLTHMFTVYRQLKHNFIEGHVSMHDGAP